MKTSDAWMMSYGNLHEMAGRLTPDQIMDYKLALQLYRTFNNRIPSRDWISLNLNYIQTSRQTTFHTNKTNRLKVGMNILSNRFNNINGKIELDWLNMPYQSFKHNCKPLFLG